jgi:hypothetical protein
MGAPVMSAVSLAPHAIKKVLGVGSQDIVDIASVKTDH